MVIYADTLFLINLIFNYMSLLVLGKLMKLSIKQLRIISGSAVGAAGTVIIFCMNIALPIFKAVPAFLMILCAYGWAGKKMVSRFAVFLLLLASISGIAIFAVSLLPAGVNSVIRNGIVYFDISGKLFFLILILAYPIVCILSKCLKSWRNRNIYIAEIQKENKSVKICALFDSGNKLREPITGKPVVIAEWDAVKALFENPVGFDFLTEKMEDYRLWIIPYHSLGNRQGRIFAFLADRIFIDGKVTERIFIGITDQKLSKEYQALLNADLI